MTSTTCLVILVAALLHASWNAVVKSGDDKMLGLALIHIVAGAICVFLLPFANSARPSGVALSGVIGDVSLGLLLAFSPRVPSG